jgi:hypothetical protein
VTNFLNENNSKTSKTHRVTYIKLAESHKQLIILCIPLVNLPKIPKKSDLIHLIKLDDTTYIPKSYCVIKLNKKDFKIMILQDKAMPQIQKKLFKLLKLNLEVPIITNTQEIINFFTNLKALK